MQLIAASENHQEETVEPQTVVDHLILLLKEYMQKRPHLSVNAISRLCNVSEPTLRRILSRKVKTLPHITTTLDILTFLSQEKSVQKIINLYPGPVAEYIKESIPAFQADYDQEYSSLVNSELKDPVKYLIYKLAANATGVNRNKVSELFGQHGQHLLDEMIRKDLILDEGEVCRTQSKGFRLGDEDFVRNFKAVADYIKPSAAALKNPLNPLFVNRSCSVNAETYEKIVKVQRKALKKVHDLLSSEDSSGSIPMFLLLGVDTLDSQPAYKLAESEQSNK